MKPTESQTPPEQPATNTQGWNLHILSPEESERLLREEPRLSVDTVLAELQRKYGTERRDG